MQTDRREFLGMAAIAAAAWGCGRAAGRSAAVGTIALDANENPYGPSERALAAIRDAAPRSCRYADATDELIAALAKRHGVTPEHVVIDTGSFAVLIAIVRTALRGGGHTVVPHPAFGAVAEYAETLGPVTRVPLDRAARHDLDALAAAVTRETRLVYTCNPNNPTGTIVPARDLRAFCARLADRTTVIVDEAYAEYVGDPQFASLDAAVRDGMPIVLVKTFSKLYGLAGLRVGYAVAPPAVAAKLRATRGGPDKVWVPYAGTRAALASLDDDAYVARTRARVAAERENLIVAIERLGFHAPEAHANFVYLQHPAPDRVAAAMAERGVRIGGRADQLGCRITIGLPAEMTTCIAALSAVLPTIH